LIDPVPERKPRRKNGEGRALAKAEAAPAPAPISQGDAFTALFERLARDPSVDPARIQQFLQMKREEEDRQAERAYNAAMAAAQAELIPVARNRPNDQTKSKYADLAAIAELALPIVHQHGFGVSCSEFRSDLENHLGVACKVTHASGHSERYEFHIPTDGTGLKGNPNKTATHAYSSTITYGRRYAICSVFNIATKDDDGNGASKKTAAPERITEQQLAELNALLQKTAEPAANVQITLQRFKVENLADLTPQQYALCVKKLNEALGRNDV
jgi:hypothetical protein